MDASLNNSTGARAGEALRHSSASDAERIERVARLAADAARLAVLEARLALGSLGDAVVLALVAGLGALVALVLAVAALAFTLNWLGLAWPGALGLTAALVSLLCYAALRQAARLARRLTMPETRRALQPTARS